MWQTASAGPGDIMKVDCVNAQIAMQGRLQGREHWISGVQNELRHWGQASCCASVPLSLVIVSGSRACRAAGEGLSPICSASQCSAGCWSVLSVTTSQWTRHHRKYQAFSARVKKPIIKAIMNSGALLERTGMENHSGLLLKCFQFLPYPGNSLW